VLITFEGIECCGKTTQSQKTVEYLKSLCLPVVNSREPGGTTVGEVLRGILKYPDQVLKGALDSIPMIDSRETVQDYRLLPLTELMLFITSRHEYVEKVLKPMLESHIVVSDRFHDSTVAYQGGGLFHNNPEILQIIDLLYTKILGGFKPHTTFFIDISVAEMERRMELSPDKSALFESRGVEYFQRVRDKYVSIAHSEPHRVFIIDGEASPEEVFADVKALVDGTLRGGGWSV
jgi:dTMP kinase